MEHIIRIARKTAVLFLILFFSKLDAQPPLSVGLGLSSSLYLLDVSSKTYPVPTLPLSPYAALKIKQHEILAGPDVYLIYNSPDILGAQAGYRYHLRKGSSEFDPFVEANFQFVRFKTGALYPERYHSTPSFIFADGNSIRHQSLVNTYGIGLQLNIQDEIMFYSVVGAGYNFRQQTVIYNYSWKKAHSGNEISFIGYIRIGASLFFYRKK